MRRVRAPWPAPLAEAAAALWGLKIAKRYVFDFEHSLELEMDALNLSKAIIARKTGCSPLDLVVDDSCVLGDRFFFFGVFHVRRCGNNVAHMITRIFSSLIWVGNNSLLIIFRKVF